MFNHGTLVFLISPFVSLTVLTGTATAADDQSQDPN